MYSSESAPFVVNNPRPRFPRRRRKYLDPSTQAVPTLPTTRVSTPVQADVMTTLELEDIQGQVVHLSRTQAGSRGLQLLFCNSATSLQAVSIVLREVSPLFQNVLCDSYGNYMAQALLHACDIDRLRGYLRMMAEVDVYAVATDTRGTHTIQVLISAVAGFKNAVGRDYTRFECSFRPWRRCSRLCFVVSPCPLLVTPLVPM
jgi:hypothetical protein